MRASLITQLVKNLPASQEALVRFLGRERPPGERDGLPTPAFLGFPCGSALKESARNVGDLGSIPGLGRSPGEGKGDPLQYSGLENSTDCIVHGVTKSRTWLNDFHSHYNEHIIRLKVYGNRIFCHLGPSWFWSVPVYIQGKGRCLWG